MSKHELSLMMQVLKQQLLCFVLFEDKIDGTFWLWHLHFPSQEEELQNSVLVVLANKQDMEGAMSVSEIHNALGLETMKSRTFQIFKTSAIRGEGLDAAMQFLTDSLTNNK